jgi:uncharacterized protein
MSLTLDDNNASYQIRGFTPGSIRVNDQTFTQSVIITSTELITNWPPQRITELKPEHLALIIEKHPRIFILGTGETLIFPSLEIYGQLINQQIGVEIMDTRAACRTYNALTAEGRDVIGAFIIK